MKKEDAIAKKHLYLKLKIITQRVLFSTLLFFYSAAFSQTTNISGIVNTYHKVIEIIPAKACVRISSTTGLIYGQKVMIVQMKGASINTTASSSSFGDTSTLNNAGNYEIATICVINGDSVFMFHNLLNNYTVADKVQLVGIPGYYSANVTGTLKAASWDNSSGTGGVLAINVTEDLTLNAPIYADSSGYRGGVFVLSNGTCFNPGPTNYAYNATFTAPQNGSYKGEGLADIAVTISGGRGAPANGGGGGNNHNNGGGGGANLTSGGKGGGNSSSTGCTNNLFGEAGKALSSWNGKKIFLGGGGGAGHANNGFVASLGGGHGGGIIFIQTKNLISNSQKISANGQQGGPALSDGASGGGAGGTIILDVLNAYSGILTIEAKGGAGGTEDDGGNINHCYGAGGGGSGGVIYFTGSLPAATISTTAGTAGAETGRDAGCNAVVPALAGSAGSVISSYTYSRSSDPAGYCASLLPAQLIYFRAVARQQKILLYWKLADPELANNFILEKITPDNRWATLDTVTANDRTPEYNSIDETPLPGNNQYRLRIIEKNNSVFLSPIRVAFINNNKNNFIVYPNPSTHKIIITGDFSPNAELKLFDLSGRLVWHKTTTNSTNSIQVDLPFLQPGTYMLRINDEVRKLWIR